MSKRCLHCGKELLPREGKKELNTKRKYCDRVCQTRYKAREWYQDNKDKPEYKERQKKRFNKWYPKNKKRQNKNILRDYHANKEIWNERHFSDRHREKIMKFINPVCSCGNPTKIIFHKQYGNTPTLKSRGEENNLSLVKKYTKENLIGVCSKMCLERTKRELK